MPRHLYISLLELAMSHTETLPVLDFSLLEGNARQRAEFLQRLNHAARETGFFYLTHHGVSPELQQRVQRVSRAFFSLPDDEKQRVAMIRTPHFRGYTLAGAERTRSAPDWREQFDIGAERPALRLLSGDPAWRRLQGPNQWPESLPALKSTLLEWQQALTRISLRLLRAFAELLGLPVTAFDALYGNKPNEHIKLIRYPGQPVVGSQQGVGAHKDSGFLTLLLQDEQPGLQVELEPDSWVDARPLPGSFVVNIGELLELATDGYLRATVHRVVSPPPGQERLSIAFFLGAQLDAVVPVFPLSPALATLARGPASDPNNPLLRDVGWNYLKGRLRSHPEVAKRYYGDVLQAQQQAETV
jgi:isopenicillin N synthase-like dioxygenase